jgi:MoxR-like ATPase
MPDDVQQMAVPVLAHRLILRADAQGATPRSEHVIQQILRQISVPVGQMGGGGA